MTIANRALDMSRMQPIAITGMGLVCPLGNCVATALDAARRGQSGIRRYASTWVDEGVPELRERVGGLVADFDVGDRLEAKFAARQEPAVLFALAAAEEALAEAKLPEGADRRRIGVAVGAGLAGAELWHRALYRAYGENRPREIPRMAAVSITGTAVTGQLALRHGFSGPSIGVANACASGTSALVLGADQIRLGRADVMLVGGCESSMRSLLSYASFPEAGMHVTRDPAGACSPFARDRRGFVLAEGAGMLVLERLEHARARGAEVIAWLCGSALTNDAHHVIAPEPSGEAWARTMLLALADADLPADAVDAVSAHATATVAGDIAEARAIRRVLGARSERVPVSATKSMHGHAFGAAGAIETALALAAMREGLVLPTINLDEPDPECELDHVRHEARRHPTRVLVKNGFGAGGVATSLVLCRDVAA
jgi:3-oxoacyl-[acyl-carrier-protein] synthase II